MCGRFSQGEPSHRISDYFGAYPDDDLPEPRFNVPPTERIRIVRQTDDGRRLSAARWGFRPAWAGAIADRAPINARAETAFDSPLFGRALRERRCVVPADAFYEWDRSTSPRQPYAIGPADGGLLALAGIVARDAEGTRTVAVLTTAPNATLARVHDRMPVLVPAVLLDAWLDPGTPPAELAPMLGPAPDASVRMWPVGGAVNRVASDGPGLLDPVEPAPTLNL
jgi:putative SOS response-associated peptidase YedK